MDKQRKDIPQKQINMAKKLKNKKLIKAIAQLDSVELYFEEQGISEHYEYWIKAKNNGLDMPPKLIIKKWWMFWIK